VGQRVEHVLADDQRVPQEKTVLSEDNGWSVGDDMAFAMVAEDKMANLLRRLILPMLDI